MKWIRMHWQNLSDHQRDGHYESSIFRHGRAWLDIGKVQYHWEWHFWVLAFAFKMNFDWHDDDLLVQIAFPGFQFFWGFQGIFPRRWRSFGQGRTIGIQIHSGSLWLDIWTDGSGWSRDWPWYAKNKCFNPANFFLGRQKYSERVLEVRDVEVPMLEKNYKVTVTLREDSWKRPRWPWPAKLLRAHVEPAKAIPVPGKGTTEYNCGQDAIHSSTFCASSITDAVAKFTADLMETRARYGGQNWKPEKVKT